MDISRHFTIIKPWEHKARITIIGAGATGSHLFMALTCLGFENITVIDFDHVESHNLANQMYDHADIGKLKVNALLDKYVAKTGEAVPDTMSFIEGRVPHPDIPIEGHVFLLTDTMKSRKEIYETCIKGNEKVINVIETRMASTHGNILSFNPMNKFQSEAWFATLTDDETTEQSLCGTSISVGMTAAIIANYAAWQLIHVMTETDCGVDKLNIFLKPVFTARENLE